MSLTTYNPQKAETEGRTMRLAIPGMTDQRIYVKVLGDDASLVEEYQQAANKAHIEVYGPGDRTPEQLKDYLMGKFAVQVVAVRTDILKGKETESVDMIEIAEDEWLPAGPDLARRIFEEDMKFVYEQVFIFARNRANFLPNSAENLLLI